MAARRTHKAAELLPASVTVLGELGACCLYDRHRDAFYDLPYRPGSILCAEPPAPGDDYSRAMFIVRPLADGNRRPRDDDQAMRALGLHERFVNRKANELFNCIVPRFREPVFAGELVIVRYTQEKNLRGVAGEQVLWEHYFVHEQGPPAYAAIYSVGGDQYYIPRGPWRVGARGIEGFLDPIERSSQ